MSAHTIPGGLPRTIWHITDDADWEKRSLESQTWCITREVRHRLQGIAIVLFDMALRGGPSRDGLAFLASSANDLALCIERAEAARRQRDDAADDAEAAAAEQARKAKAVKQARLIPTSTKVRRRKT